MYRFLDRLTPDDVEAIAALAYVEMLEAGFTARRRVPLPAPRPRRRALCRSRRDGRSASSRRPRRDRHRPDAAAGVLRPRRLRRRSRPRRASAASSPTSTASRGCWKRAARRVAGLPDAVRRRRAAFAARRRRRTSCAALAARWPATGRSTSTPPSRCRRSRTASPGRGARPVEWLLDHAGVDARWCLIHATHMTAGRDRARWPQSGAVAGLCPITEANLGDGIFPARRLSCGAAAAFGVGTDSNVLIDARRRAARARICAAPDAPRRATCWRAPGGSIGRARCSTRALAGGAQALGAARPGSRSARRADIVVARPRPSRSLAGRARRRAARRLDLRRRDPASIASGAAAAKQVEGGRHPASRARSAGASAPPWRRSPRSSA